MLDFITGAVDSTKDEGGMGIKTARFLHVPANSNIVTILYYDKNVAFLDSNNIVTPKSKSYMKSSVQYLHD